MPAEPARFLNVDLDVAARTRLDGLVAALTPRLFLLHHGRIRGLDHASFEVTRMTRTADATIRELVRVIRALRPAAKRLWNGARVRDFNLGIQAGAEPHSFELALEAATVQSVAALGGRIVVTVYAPDRPRVSASRRRRRPASR